MIATLDEIDIKIDRKLVCRYIGYSDDVEPSPRIASILDEYIENAKHLIDPVYSYLIKQVQRVNESSATIEGSIVLRGKVISDLLRKCDKVALFVLTIGDRLEEMAGKLADDGMIVESYVLDAIGSSAAESLAEYVQTRIGSYAYCLGRTISRRFSPGYCDWDIKEQEKLFRAIDGHSLGVRLSEDFLMVPQKSISGIIGLGTAESNVRNYNPCKTCQKRNCVGRR